MKTFDISTILARTTLFAQCPVDSNNFVKKHYKKGQLVSDQVNGVPSIGILASGSIYVYSLSPDGMETSLTTLYAADIFGICNIFSPCALKTVLKCHEPADIFYLSKNSFLCLLQHSPELMTCYAQLCNHKIQFLLQRIELLTMQSCRGKLCRYLLDLCAEKNRLELAYTKEHLAKILGVSRAALFREIAALQAEELILVQKDYITILNRNALTKRLYLC